MVGLYFLTILHFLSLYYHRRADQHFCCPSWRFSQSEIIILGELASSLGVTLSLHPCMFPNVISPRDLQPQPVFVDFYKPKLQLSQDHEI